MQPSLFSAAINSAYWEGAVAMVTYRWFFAELRNMDGPPMSTFSTQVSKSEPLATVASKA